MSEEMHGALWLLSQEMDLATQFYILDEAVSVSLHASAFGKGMNSLVLSPAMGQ